MYRQRLAREPRQRTRHEQRSSRHGPPGRLAPAPARAGHLRPARSLQRMMREGGMSKMAGPKHRRRASAGMVRRTMRAAETGERGGG